MASAKPLRHPPNQKKAKMLTQKELRRRKPTDSLQVAASNLPGARGGGLSRAWLLRKLNEKFYNAEGVR